MLLSDKIFSRLNRAAIRNFSLILQTRKHTKLRPDPVRGGTLTTILGLH
jgi:hypothetical protein